MSTVRARRAFHVHLLASVLTHEGHVAFWYLCPENGPTLVTNAPTEPLNAALSTVNTALRLRGRHEVNL